MDEELKRGEKQMSKKVFKVLGFIEDMFCVGMVVVGIALITLNLTPNMPLYGLVMMLLGLLDVIEWE